MLLSETLQLPGMFLAHSLVFSRVVVVDVGRVVLEER